MADLQELAKLVPVLAMVGVFSAPAYALLSAPGLGACLILRRYLWGSFWVRALAMSAVVAGLLTPVLVPGHSPLILPFPFGLWLSLHMGNVEAVRAAMYCEGVAAVALCLLTLRYWRRERAGSKVRGWLESFWRRRPTTG